MAISNSFLPLIGYIFGISLDKVKISPQAYFKISPITLESVYARGDRNL